MSLLESGILDANTYESAWSANERVSTTRSLSVKELAVFWCHEPVEESEPAALLSSERTTSFRLKEGPSAPLQSRMLTERAR
ncbi:MAG: hypothetical protein LC797_21510 [Chloroflexi bacterium]|nr:hypothetical protein [Chloroflexota bacterium]